MPGTRFLGLTIRYNGCGHRVALADEAGMGVTCGCAMLPRLPQPVPREGAGFRRC